MSTEDKLRTILVDLYCERLTHFDASDEEIDEIVGDDDFVFIKEHLKDLTTPGMVDSFYNNLFFYFYLEDNDKNNIFNCNDECNRYAVSNYLIAYIFENYILYHYNDPKFENIIKTIAESRFSILRLQYYENEEIAKKMLKCLFHSLAKPEICEANRELMKKNNEEHLIKNFDSRIKNVTISINDFLRILFNQYFNQLICQQYSLKDAVLAATVWLFSDEDVMDTFKNMNLTREEILSYKKYLRKLIIADVYEDAMNSPTPYSIDSDEHKKKEEVAVAMSIYAISCNKELSDFNKDQILYFIYHYIKLIQDEVKTISNRISSIDNDRLKIIKKYNPSFMFDEL